jgi:hypothetical protein
MGNLVTTMTELCKYSVPLRFDSASLGYRNPTGCLETSVPDSPMIQPHAQQYPTILSYIAAKTSELKKLFNSPNLRWTWRQWLEIWRNIQKASSEQSVSIPITLQKQETEGETAERNNWLGYWLDGREIVLRYPEEARESYFSKASRPAHGTNKLPTQWRMIPRSKAVGKWSWKIRLLLVLRISRIKTLTPHIPSRGAILAKASLKTAWYAPTF